MRGAKHAQHKAELYRKLLRHEAEIGGKLFGDVKPGGRREFFCLDERTWIWHEEWLDELGQLRYATTRYDVTPNNIRKFQNGQYKSITPQEAQNLLNAANIYQRKINEEIYSHVK